MTIGYARTFLTEKILHIDNQTTYVLDQINVIFVEFHGRRKIPWQRV